MTTAKTIAGTAVGLGSLALVARSSKMLNESMKSKPSSKKMVKGYVDLAVGTAMLVPISQAVNQL